ncbi:MAG: bifunctional 4-hydroxy-2-oxoglutarate aldolase/2-dehydro-3-deoxy-phosphogluconate aldolase [Hyphomicrobiaceae bacterium]|nr:bifunctional 4-hydroxy-2-oxoglutarate aldolase/2-dehydro-3-deoxy-phosphogluconate aldolase [Hyphomicrobiaceae bacterium]
MQSELNQALGDTLYRVGVVPVLTIDSAEGGIAAARSLARGGLDLIEVTLRTPAALEAIRRIRAEVPLARIGAGTVLTPEQADLAIDAGARFIVSPGMTPRLVEAAQSWSVPFLPGAVTASEAMALSDLGYRCLKFFPAEAAGGVAALKALAAPLAAIQFCPTGGIDERNVRDYLALPNVCAVGGSWLAPKAAMAEGDWDLVTGLARDAAAIRRS